MLRYLSDYKRESVLAPLFKMLEATFDLFVPLVMADIVNVGIAAHDFHYILVRCGILLLLAIVGLACSLTAQYFSAKAAVGYSTGLRHALFEHIQTLSFSEMDTMGTSTLITRMTSDVNQVQSGLNLFLRLFLRSPFVVIGAMIMAFTVNFRAALIFVVAIPLLSVVVFGVMVITRPLYKSVQTRLDRVLGLTRENLTGVRVVRAFDKERSEVDRFEDANELLTQMQLHVGHISALMNPLTYVIINLAIVALLYVGSIEINVGGMASGDVIALVNYMNQILVELVKLANLIVQISKALACAGRVQAVLDTKPGMTFPAELLGEVPADKTGDAVRFDHVGLTYAGAGAPSLTDISFTAKKGQTIGVIGGTGSGKSSLVNLIPRFYDATEGSVEIFGRPVASYPRDALRGRVAVVMQKAQLFGGTIRSNLLWGNKDATDADLWAALETAQAADFVRAKPLGLDEPVEQGGRNLSGGQKQRVAIARALVNRPKVLLLDEPLGALDLRLRKDMQIELKRIQQQMGITFIYVTHDQEEALTMSDTVVVMDKGRIQQIGTPEDIYNEPKNAFVADFIGESNILNGIMVRDNVVKMYGKEFPCVDGGFAPNEPVDVVIRPEDIDIVPVEQGQLVGTVTGVTFKGMQYDIIVDFRGFKWLIQTTDHSPVGARIGVKIDPDGFHIMKKSQYSGMFGDYSSYSEEYEELADASVELEEEESEDED